MWSTVEVFILKRWTGALLRCLSLKIDRKSAMTLRQISSFPFERLLHLPIVVLLISTIVHVSFALLYPALYALKITHMQRENIVTLCARQYTRHLKERLQSQFHLLGGTRHRRATSANQIASHTSPRADGL